jgi:hypothetical protein
MRILGVLIVLFLILSSCNNSINKSNAKKHITIGNTSNALDGVWSSNEKSNADFGIYGDSIFYVDPNLWYKISYIQDTLKIYKEDKYIERILVQRVDKDSLILKYIDIDIILRYKKRKK